MNDDKKIRAYRIIVVILLIIILLLMFINKNRVGKIYYPVSTGNIDFFDIDVHAVLDTEEIFPDNLPNASGNDSVRKVKKLYSINGQTITNIDVFNPETDKEILGKVFVDDKNGDYLYQQRLAIFENAAFEYETKIAPGVSNSYNFVVHNSSEIALKYYIEMYEESEYEVNLKYRLKKANQYVIGDDSTWVKADQLKTEFANIGISTSDSYTLDWKWEYEDGIDDKDTLAGENMTSEYKLNIRVHFEE